MVQELTVLVVDDDPDNRNVLSTLLEHFGYTVLQCGDGEDALAVAAEQRPDVVVMDVSLPGIDGWTTTEMLKGDEGTAAIPVIALTGDTLPADAARARAVGCAGYLTKPCEASALLAEISRVVS